MYNRELDGLEEKNIKASIIAAQNISKQKDQKLTLERPYQYHFELSKSYLKRVYDLRPPRGQSKFSPADKNKYNIIQNMIAFINENKGFEAGTYRMEMLINEKVQDVQMTLRKTDIETFNY